MPQEDLLTIANPLLFVALIIVLRKLGLNGNFKMAFLLTMLKMVLVTLMMIDD